MHFSPYLLTPIFGWTLLFVVCGGAFFRGGAEERIAAGALLLGYALTLALRDHSWSGTQWTTFWVDGGFLAVLGAIAMRSRRYWPIWAAGFQLLSLVTHIARSVDPGVRSWAYQAAEILWTWLVLIAIGVGVRASWRERQLAKAASPAVAAATRR